MRKNVNVIPFTRTGIGYIVGTYDENNNPQFCMEGTIAPTFLDNHTVEIIFLDCSGTFKLLKNATYFTLSPVFFYEDKGSVYLGIPDFFESNEDTIVSGPMINAPYYRFAPIVFECKEPEVAYEGKLIKTGKLNAKVVNIIVEDSIVDSEDEIYMNKAFSFKDFACMKQE